MGEYINYSDIVRLKILILKYGVKFEPLNLFNMYNNINQYKVKRRIVKPVRKDFQVYDISKDITIIPSEIIIKYNNMESIVKLRYSIDSPITIKIDQANNLYFKVKDKIEENIKIQLVKKPLILQEKIPSTVLQNKSTIGDYIDIVGIDRVSILFFEGCYNWLSGNPCKFCDLHPKEVDSLYKPSLNTLKKFNFNVKNWWDYYKLDYLKGLKYSLDYVLKKSNLKHIHLFFMAGNMPNVDDVCNIAEETIDYLKKDINISKYDNYLNISPHDNIDRIIRIKESGINQLQYNLEVVNKNNFSFTCPGKMPYEIFKNKLYEAVYVMGKGNVRSNFVLGLDSMSETLLFVREIANKGVVFDYSIFQPKKNTPYANRSSPNFDEVILFTQNLVEIYKEKNSNQFFVL